MGGKSLLTHLSLDGAFGSTLTLFVDRHIQAVS